MLRDATKVSSFDMYNYCHEGKHFRLERIYVLEMPILF